MNGDIKVEQTDAADLYPAGKGKKCKRQRKPKEGPSEKLDKKEKKPALKQEMLTDHMPVEKKKRKINRFNGMPEEEVVLRTLPDHLAPDLDIVIVGINPGLMAAYIGHHYAGPGNHFWKCLYLSGLVPEPKNCYDDFKLLDIGIGFTNICARTTRGSADLKKTEIKEGAEILKEKLREYRPKIAAFNGKGIYEIFSGSKNIYFGKQPEFIEGTNTIAFVMPSSSARCAQLPRAIDKVPFYDALRKLRDHLVGRIPQLDDAEVTFPNLELKCVKKEEPKEEAADSPVINTGCIVNGTGEANSNQASGGVGNSLAVVNMSSEETSNLSTVLPSIQGIGQQNGQVESMTGTSRQGVGVGQSQTFVTDGLQMDGAFNMQQQQQQQQHFSLQQQQQHLQHRLWEQQQQSLIGLPQALPVTTSHGAMHPSGSNASSQSSQIPYSQSATFGMMSQLFPYASDFSSHQGFDALGFPIGASGQYLHQQDVEKSNTSEQQAPQIKREPVDASFLQS